MSLIKGTNGKISELQYFGSDKELISLSKLYYGDKLIWKKDGSDITVSGSLLSLDGLILLSSDNYILKSNDNG